MALTINHQTNDISATSGSMTIDGTAVGGGGIAGAWANFSGYVVGPTFSARDSYNISSLYDNGTGDTTISFSTNCANANYAVTFGTSSYASSALKIDSNNSYAASATLMSTSQLRIKHYTTGTTVGAVQYQCFHIFGDF